MMKCNASKVVTISVISLLYTVKNVTSILCYDCNSAYDPRCGQHFDPFSLGIVNCSLRDPPEHIPETEPTICRSIKMEIYDKIRVVRTCGYLTDEPGEQACQRRAGNGEVYVTYCSCDTDLCNSSARCKNWAFLTALVLAAVFKITM